MANKENVKKQENNTIIKHWNVAGNDNFDSTMSLTGPLT